MERMNEMLYSGMRRQVQIVNKLGFPLNVVHYKLQCIYTIMPPHVMAADYFHVVLHPLVIDVFALRFCRDTEGG